MVIASEFSVDIFQDMAMKNCAIRSQCLSQIVALLQPMQEFFVGDLSITTWPNQKTLTPVLNG